MAWFQSKQEQLAENLQEEKIYTIVALELANKDIRPGLWAKATVEAAGNEQLAQSVYIKLRAAQVKLETKVAAEMLTSAEQILSAPKAALPTNPHSGTLREGHELRRLLGYDVPTVAAPRKDVEVTRKVSEKELKRRRLLGYDD